MAWYGPRGNCGCCTCLFSQYDYRYEQPTDDEPAGDSSLELLGNASHNGLAGFSGEGMVLLPDSTSGIKLKEGQPLPNFEHAVVGFQVLTPVAGLPGGWNPPVGSTYRIFFESDYDEQNYVFADIIAQATSSSYATTVRNWLIRLGHRIGGSDTYYESWSQVFGLGFPAVSQANYNPFLVLERRGCKALGPIGCTEGYACHYYARNLPAPKANTSRFDPEHYCWEPLSAAYNWEYFPDRVEIDANEPLIAASEPPGASIDVPLSDPAGTYCGIRRMDDLGEDLAVFAVGIGNAKPTPEPCRCLAGSFSAHNVCREVEPFSILVEIPGEFTIIGDSLGQRDFRYLGFTSYLENPLGNQRQWAFGSVVNGSYPLILQYEIACDHKLVSTRPGEQDWFSRGQNDSLEEFLYVTLLDRRQYDPVFPGNNEYYRYTWQVRITIPEGDRDIECTNLAVTLSFADAEIFYQAPDGPSIYDPLTGDLTMTLY